MASRVQWLKLTLHCLLVAEDVIDCGRQAADVVGCWEIMLFWHGGK
ncbi:hypothetical protein LN994_004821 [Salmonella enterica]|nr:hypothetical protein [Salmonella enterica subsp. enterica]EGI6200936.1 hypothetical protein [Salmonella enterica subsp. enterica serovar Eastbourne]EIN0011995.1 hypothetical protein [Salmonella enterica]EDV0774462.1 hypothetical protein [Salmonella enterica subsp. enterica]EJP6695905.1 hypothetical protein [Salmonella enterica]